MINMRISTCRLLAIAGAIAFAQPAVAQDAGRGKAVFEQCAACHSLDSGHHMAEEVPDELADAIRAFVTS